MYRPLAPKTISPAPWIPVFIDDEHIKLAWSAAVRSTSRSKLAYRKATSLSTTPEEGRSCRVKAGTGGSTVALRPVDPELAYESVHCP